MLYDLRKAAPWLAVFIFSLFLGVCVTRAARHCLLHRQFGVGVGIVHRVAAPFWGLYCERADGVVLKPTFFD